MPGKQRPNILLIFTDQQRWDTLGCYGAPQCRTPHIDGLAARGVRFDAAYTPTSPCSPARAALFTGLYPHKNNVPMNGGNLNQSVPNLASELGAAGYQLGYAGKWHVDQAHVPSEYGFEAVDFPGYGYPPVNGLIPGLRYMASIPMPAHYADWLKAKGLEPPKMLAATYGDNPGKPNQEMYALQSGDIESSFETMVADHAVTLMRQFAAQQQAGDDAPFFLWANFWGPHTPCFIPEPYYSMYDPASIPEEPNFNDTWAGKPGAHDIYARIWGLRSGGWAGWREIVARYWGYCTMIDDLVGRMLAELRALGMEEETLVVYTTDHGDQMGSHGMIEKGPFAYEESWRLPMVAAHPANAAPGSVCREFVQLTDLFPTFLEAAGLAPPDVPDSQSILANVLGQEAPTGRDSVYGAFYGHILPTPLRWVRTKRFKLVYNLCDIGELYDLEADPGELHNLIADPALAETKRALLDEMRAHMVRLKDPALRDFDGIRHVY
jgi:arylsulfatase A-like enzyme